MGGERVDLRVWVLVCYYGCGFGFAVGLGLPPRVAFSFLFLGGIDGRRGWHCGC